MLWTFPLLQYLTIADCVERKTVLQKRAQYEMRPLRQLRCNLYAWFSSRLIDVVVFQLFYDCFWCMSKYTSITDVLICCSACFL